MDSTRAVEADCSFYQANARRKLCLSAYIKGIEPAIRGRRTSKQTQAKQLPAPPTLALTGEPVVDEPPPTVAGTSRLILSMATRPKRPK
jgi:hypothetical protein